jgi:predicted TIM-barrel fold metal-dependent hydrolase
MRSLPVTDTHVHFHDFRHPQLRYEWMSREAPPHPDLGDISAIKAERYWADDFLAETRFAGVTRVVHVQAAIGSPDPVIETEWLDAFAERTGIPHGIVAGADLASSDAPRVLERHMAFRRVIGIRDFRDDDYLQNPAWERGFGLLERHSLVCCDSPRLQEYDLAAAIARRHPGITLCIDHAGYPRLRDQEYFERWRTGLTRLAAPGNTVVKISGLGQCDHGWTIDTLRPWILTCIEAFGTERTFFGTNWPVDRLYSSYGDVLAAYKAIVADFSEDEQRALLAGNADRVFRLDDL